MKAPRRAPEPGDLLAGDDHDFVVNLYLALLRRWPDEAGYRHFLGMVAGRPERRLDALREMSESEEVRRAGTAPEIGPGPVVPADPRRALAVSLDLRASWMRDQVAELREAVDLLGGTGGPELAGFAAELIEARDAALRSEIGALRREVAELRDLLERRGDAGGAPPPSRPGPGADDPLPGRFADYVGDLLAIAEARFEARLRAMEARALRASPPKPSEPDSG